MNLNEKYNIISEAFTPDMRPAKWIWLPSQRTLCNTFVLFRKVFEIDGEVTNANGWITADSRYNLTVNGRLVQRGPAPSDPRWPDVDPFDITGYLKPGKNVLGITVLYYGLGDGTWVMGKPGLLFKLDIEYNDGRSQKIVSDETWSARVDRSHRPGQYKRWYLRCLQEEFDARLYPWGWNTINYIEGAEWIACMIMDCPPDKPVLCSTYRDYLFESNFIYKDKAFLRSRQIPSLKEYNSSVKSLVKAATVIWKLNPLDWFDFRVNDAFTVLKDEPEVINTQPNTWEISCLKGHNKGIILTFEIEEQVVGWPYFSIDAPEGTVVELICQEAHDPSTCTWMDNHFFNWSRFICREGMNDFEAFEYESLRWIQLHIRNTEGRVVVRNVGVRRRIYDWPNKPKIHCSDKDLQRLFNAGINTIYNGAQETIVDGMGRERQQYGGDISHCLQAIRYAMGDIALSKRFIRTYSEGITTDGYLLDCWPAYDRIVRLSQRQLGLTEWGPILDHSVQFAFDNWNYFFETGDKEALNESYPRLVKISNYLESIRKADGMIPVENLGIPVVWMDHDAYKLQRHKKCAFNLYVSAMFTNAMAPIARLFGDMELARNFAEIGTSILNAVINNFWSEKHGLFVNNLPWLYEEGTARLCDRSLATSVIFEQCPADKVKNAINALLECPNNMGLSYPANSGWRYWALAKAGFGDAVLRELREKWSNLPSVIINKTLQENWVVRADSVDQWSHMPVVPIYILFTEIAGIKPVEPGFAQCLIQPQLGDLQELELTAYTVKGPIQFRAVKIDQQHYVTVTVPRQIRVMLPQNREHGNSAVMIKVQTT